jgi:uncharacterized protein YjbI with pentapeptide repeats
MIEPLPRLARSLIDRWLASGWSLLTSYVLLVCGLILLVPEFRDPKVWLKDSSSIRDLLVSIAAIGGVPFLIWREWNTHRATTAALHQAEIADERHRRQTEADRARWITDGFSKAIESLSKPEIEARLGAIYVLERIAYESQLDHWVIMEILTAYLRNRYRFALAESPKIVPFPVDAQAVLTVISRRKHEYEEALQKIDLDQTNIAGANLENAMLKGASLQGANLNGIRLKGANLEGASLNISDLQDADLEGANLKAVWFLHSKLQKANLERANLERANLHDADLASANLQGTNLKGAWLIGAKLAGAHLQGADIEGGYLTTADLAGADLAGARLVAADLRGANLQDANFRRANLRNARFSSNASAPLVKANLRGANFTGANLEGADLEGVDLDGAIFTSANLEGAKLPMDGNIKDRQDG